MHRVTIVVPAKDEEVGLQYLIRDFKDSKIHEEYVIKFIIVIDERTSDNSRMFAERLSERIIDQRGSHGKGDAIQQAISHLEEVESEFVIFLDADGSYSFNGVRAIISALEDGADVVSGSRFLDCSGRPKGMSWTHNFGNHLLSNISSFRNRRKISDLCTGLWGFTSESIKSMDIKSKGFDLEAELAGLATKKNLHHVEVPIEWSQRKGGRSKLRSIRDGTVILLRILRT
jgi:dolichol-phosphate mannosyltransferase